MVDREARNLLALALRRLAAGRITNNECDDLIGQFLFLRDRPAQCHCGYDLRGGPHERCPECGEISDAALPELALFAWSHYSDLDTYALKGRHALTREQRRLFAKAVIFLQSDREYSHNLFVSRSGGLSSMAWYLGVPAATYLIAFFLQGHSIALILCLAVYFLLIAAAWAHHILLNWLAERCESSADDEDVLERGWPFSSKGELRLAVEHPVFLSGPHGQNQEAAEDSQCESPAAVKSPVS